MTTSTALHNTLWENLLTNAIPRKSKYQTRNKKLNMPLPILPTGKKLHRQSFEN